ncbi:hypothetical protein B0T21DRAFT_358582 [Apiosordaria backusii]|uniref:DUF6594 domain-containing protein n=1 Tax=Apiosordaria backusii TaxID=314023 RepID=A0AA40K3V0_9PEZI|nr:hypothetical protein B0T21DRAFT_358582 [Apiosordaria backusii]
MTQTEDDLEGLKLDDPAEWISEKYRRNLIRPVEEWVPIWSSKPASTLESKSYRISVAELQRMRMQRLQIKLVGVAKRIYDGSDDDKEWDSWSKTLSEYVNAVQEHDYMEQRGGGTRDPFLISGERYMDREVLKKALSNFELLPEDNRKPLLLTWQSKAFPPVSTRGDNRLSKLITRIGIAAVGTAFLIVPMWLLIWVFWGDIWAALWLTTVFVAAFGVLMACVLQDNIAVLSASAAYAAVLVVFVALIAEQSRAAPELET